MAATVTSAWAKPRAWALEVEESDAAEAAAAAVAHVAEPEPSDFPTLAAAASAKASKKNKKLSLAEFTTGQSVAPGSGRGATRLTTNELLSLPTGPRERTAEELERGPSYRGFNYSSYGGGPRDEPRRAGLGDAPPREPPPPSRADEIDDWGAMKRSSAGVPPSPVEAGRRERGGGFFDSQSSRADESDRWISNKVAPLANGRRGEGFRERRGGFEFHREGGGGSGAEGDTWGRRREEPSSAAAGRPKLVLQPRTLPLESNVGEHQSQQQQQQQQAGKARGANPFGEARPREEVLAGKGQDWKKIDEKLESMKIREASPLSRESSSGFGRRGSSRSVDRTERKWRKDESDASPPPPAAAAAESSEPAEQSASDD